MTPILLGVLGQGVAGAASAGSYYSIQTATVDSGGTSDITFSSIPTDGTYKHLQLRVFSKLSGNENVYLNFKFNSDTTESNYRSHWLSGTGSNVYGDTYTNPSYLYMNTSSSQTNAWAVGVFDILDYTNTNKYKVMRGLHGWDSNGGGNVKLTSLLWQSTNAISSIKFEPISANSGTPTIVQYSQFALYGIKA